MKLFACSPTLGTVLSPFFPPPPSPAPLFFLFPFLSFLLSFFTVHCRLQEFSCRTDKFVNNTGLTSLLATQDWQVCWEHRTNKFVENTGLTSLLTTQDWQVFWQHRTDKFTDNAGLISLLTTQDWQVCWQRRTDKFVDNTGLTSWLTTQDWQNWSRAMTTLTTDRKLTDLLIDTRKTILYWMWGRQRKWS